jgi:Kef-type K+ transport system membrane component KefB
MHNASLILTLLWQIALILAISRIMGALFARLGQPQVVGEMIAGIALGPSLFGLLAPHAWAAVFPADTIVYLNLLSQLGVILFLFLIGLELDPKLLANRGHAAIVISHVSIVAPFLLGSGLTLYLYPRLFNDTHAMRFTAVALFMGAAMSVTAFPVLARILTERNLHRTTVGAISITCAAVDDVTAWCMLAFVVAVSRATGMKPALFTAGLSIAYIVGMFFVVRPLLRGLELYYQRQGRISRDALALILTLVLASAMLTEAIGIHALFGAFLMGAMMPKGSNFIRDLAGKLEDFIVVFLLPIFFAYAGLKTHIGLLNSPELWGITLLIIGVACAGKFGGSTLAARLCGLGWRESSAIGILMNTRGLMELVILNVGRELGVITDAVFAMMVIMALLTTALTTPILSIIYPDRLFAAQPGTTIAAKAFSVLATIARPQTTRGRVLLARVLAGKEGRVSALHLKHAVDHDAYRGAINAAEADRDEALEQMLRESTERTEMDEILPSVAPISRVSIDLPTDIASMADALQANLLLMGFDRPVFGHKLLGGTVHRVMSNTACDVGVLVDRGLKLPRRVLVPYLGSSHDKLALELARRLARNIEAVITVLHVVPVTRKDVPALGARSAVDKVFQDPTQPTPVTFRVIEDDAPVNVVIREAADYDLVMIGVAEKWGLESHVFGWKAERIAEECPTSMLIVRKAQSSIDKA